MSVLREVANQADYGTKEQCLAQIGAATARPSTLTENLEAKKQSLEQQLERVNAALEALKANPDFEKMITLLSQV